MAKKDKLPAVCIHGKCSDNDPTACERQVGRIGRLFDIPAHGTWAQRRAVGRFLWTYLLIEYSQAALRTNQFQS